MTYIVTDLPPIIKSDEWGVRFDSPFSLAAEDLCRFYFFNYRIRTGNVPPFEDVHNLIHDTEWFVTNGHRCPGKEAIKRVYDKCKEEIA